MKFAAGTALSLFAIATALVAPIPRDAPGFFDELEDGVLVDRSASGPEPFDALAEVAVDKRSEAPEPFDELAETDVEKRSPYPAFYDELSEDLVAREADPGWWDDVKDKAKEIGGNIIDTISDASDGRIDNCNLIPCAADLSPTAFDCAKAAVQRGRNAKDSLTCISGVSSPPWRSHSIYSRVAINCDL
jgi:hypothetical protein